MILFLISWKHCFWFSFTPRLACSPLFSYPLQQTWGAACSGTVSLFEMFANKPQIIWSSPSFTICCAFSVGGCLNSEVFSGHLAWLSVLQPNWVEFVAPLFWCETWLVQPNFAVSSGAHVVFWLEGISLIKLILYSCKHTKLPQLLPINYQFVSLPITTVLVCKWYRLWSFLPCVSLPTAVPHSSASTPALRR